MDLQDCGAENSETPTGKMNRTAFKLFVKRKSGSAMPSIFGVRSKGEAAKGRGLPRSQTHDGLAAEAAAGLESSKKEESSHTETRPGVSDDTKPVSAPKTHGFFSLLRKGGGGKSEPGPQQPPSESKAGKQRRGGLRGLLSGMQRWRRGFEPPPVEPLSASLTASMERIPEEPPPPPLPEEEPREAEDDESPLSSLHIEDIIQEAEGRAGEEEEEETFCQGPEDEEAPLEEQRGPADDEGALAEASAEEPPPAPVHTRVPLAALEPPHAELTAERAGLLFTDAASLKSFDSLTGCGDITAEPEEERSGEPEVGVVEEEEPPPQEPLAPETVPIEQPPPLLIYQGGGEEMASPEGVDDPELQDFWQGLPRPQEHEAPAIDCPPLSTEDRSSPKGSPSPTEDPATPELVSPRHLEEERVSRGSCSGEALYNLSPEPREERALPEHTITPVTLTKSLSPVTATCPLKATTGGGAKDSRIPVSRKHLPVHCPQPAQQPPSKSEIPRTKIPVSKVLVRRVSNKVLTGTTYKTSTLQDTGKK
ncbi:hypothetical protein NDU88_002162 [Pleurodeles waltl]|uniref:APC membrane recruitment protein 2 n=1 Tax=Pleurodeles waltl TaxID=8319 RepID=A0AAV7NCV5_PLEWA|nr:hypothetical protein NDU88_002162 [Pleurodeles waltl]